MASRLQTIECHEELAEGTIGKVRDYEGEQKNQLISLAKAFFTVHSSLFFYLLDRLYDLIIPYRPPGIHYFFRNFSK